jgi:uncharacterized repeat protein (TIGR02543 family)
MQSKFYFEMQANGNLSRFTREDDVIYQGQVGTVEYYLTMAADAGDNAWVASDVVFIALTRPDGRSTQRLMIRDGDGWYITSNGWESDVEVEESGDVVTVSFIARRYTSSDYATYSTKTTQQITVPIMPSSGFTPLDISEEDVDELLQVIGDVQDKANAAYVRVSLVDFTVNAETGIATKLYSNGTTATVQLPTGVSASQTPQGITVLTFEDTSFTDGELAFTAEQTGQTGNIFLAQLERANGTGYDVSADVLFKGSDGSILLSGVSEGYDGRILISKRMDEDLAAISAAITSASTATTSANNAATSANTAATSANEAAESANAAAKIALEAAEQAKEILVVDDIAARDAIVNKFEGLRVHVIDATADETVESGWAEYLCRADGESYSWTKTSENDSIDVIMSAGNVTVEEENPAYYHPVAQNVESHLAAIDGALGNRLIIPSGDGTKYLADNGGYQTPDSVPTEDSEELVLSGGVYAALQTVGANATLTYNYAGADGGNSETEKNVVFGQTYGTLPTPTKTGYTFLGWFTAASGGTEITSELTVNGFDTNGKINIYAQWELAPTDGLAYTYVSASGYSVAAGTVTTGAVKVAATYNDGTHGELPVFQIAYNGFYNVPGITSVSLPSSISSFAGGKAFKGCTGLTSINLPTGITSLPAECFRDCTSLPSITLPSTLTALPASCFRDCDVLNNVTLPSGIATIGDYAFYRCYALDTLVCERATPPTISNATLSSTDLLNGTITVPYGSGAAYKAASNWSTYASQIVEAEAPNDLDESKISFRSIKNWDGYHNMSSAPGIIPLSEQLANGDMVLVKWRDDSMYAGHNPALRIAYFCVYDTKSSLITFSQNYDTKSGNLYLANYTIRLTYDNENQQFTYSALPTRCILSSVSSVISMTLVDITSIEIYDILKAEYELEVD